jgi:hypothetical protein
MKFLVPLMVIALVASLVLTVTGCGGGTQQNNASQGSKAQQSKQEQPSKHGAPKRESLSGTVAKTLQDKDKVIIRPENGKVVRLKYRPEKVEVTLEGKAAKPDAISKGQKATVEYVKRTNKKDREVNIAKSIQLKSRTGAKHGGETTG